MLVSGLLSKFNWLFKFVEGQFCAVFVVIMGVMVVVVVVALAAATVVIAVVSVM